MKLHDMMNELIDLDLYPSRIPTESKEYLEMLNKKFKATETWSATLNIEEDGMFKKASNYYNTNHLLERQLTRDYCDGGFSLRIDTKTLESFNFNNVRTILQKKIQETEPLLKKDAVKQRVLDIMANMTQGIFASFLGHCIRILAGSSQPPSSSTETDLASMLPALENTFLIRCQKVKEKENRTIVLATSNWSLTVCDRKHVYHNELHVADLTYSGTTQFLFETGKSIDTVTYTISPVPSDASI